MVSPEDLGKMEAEAHSVSHLSFFWTTPGEKGREEAEVERARISFIHGSRMDYGTRSDSRIEKTHQKHIL